MKDLRKGLLLVAFCSFSIACVATVDDEDFASKQQAIGVETRIERVWALDGDSAEVLCTDAGFPSALSVNGGIAQPGSIKEMYFSQNDGDPVGGVVTMTGGANPYAVAVCSNYSFPTRLWTYDSDGDASLSCPSNHVAVGGGGVCTSSNGKLLRNRPAPSNEGDEPTAWRATCTTGGAWAYVNCAEKGGSRDWDGCEVRRASTSWGSSPTSVWAFCDSGELAVGTGSFCDGSTIRDQNVTADLESANVICNGSKAVAYAICCPGVYTE